MSRRTVAVAWTLAVVVACWIPSAWLPQFGGLGGGGRLPGGSDKWVHALMFAGVGLLWVRVAEDRLGLVVAGGLALALLTEAGQAVLPVGRSMDVLDGAADVLGLALGAGAAWWAARRAQNASR